MDNIVINQGNGWYNFEGINQEKRYIKVYNVHCITDRKAINQARKILGDKLATITIELANVKELS